MARIDPHSYADDTQPSVIELSWSARVDFATRTLEAEATLSFAAPAAAGPLDLDSRDLTIASVRDDQGRDVPFEVATADSVLGSKITLTLAEGARSVTLAYRAAPTASALQWLEPAQTAGGVQPFLFSQCQAIHARSIVPLQDTPSRRIRYAAELDVPAALRGLMAAGFVSREVKGDRAIERWSMQQPIAPYLFAFAVGELEARDIGRVSKVWAEPSVLERAAYEFAGVDRMIDAGEALFGPYAWERFDVLVMPPSFPYGGMENPRLTFVTPTLIAGDRSQVRVIAHELAHAWSGNLVTNANAEHFWLNEGFTRYAELRITEVVEGVDTAALVAAICRIELDEAVARFEREGRAALTKLRTHLDGVDPDDAFSSVPYDKGELFLRAIEAEVGRERFDAYVKSYLAEFRFGAVTSEEFVRFTEAQLPGVLARVEADAWLDGEGVPANAPVAASKKLDRIVAMGAELPPADVVLTPTEWNLWLERVPRPMPQAFCAALDERFHFTRAGNMELKVAWLRLAISSKHDAVLDEVDAVLGSIGRMKYLLPLYGALLERPETRQRARTTFERVSGRYHPVAKAVVKGRIDAAG